MTSKQHYIQFKRKAFDTPTEACWGLFNQLYTEAKVYILNHNIKTKKGELSVHKRMSKKWNKIMDYYSKDGLMAPFFHDIYIQLLVRVEYEKYRRHDA